MSKQTFSQDQSTKYQMDQTLKNKIPFIRDLDASYKKIDIVLDVEMYTLAVNGDSCNGACHPGGHYWNYYAGTLSFTQTTTTHL